MSFRGFPAVAVLCGMSVGVSASDRSVTVLARTTISERTSLSVSANILEFVVAPGSTGGTASLEFTSGVRTRPGSEVLVVAEVMGPFPGALTFSGGGDGLTAGSLGPGGTAVIARYVGGGQRQGRIVFTLDGVQPGTHAIPIRLSVSVL